MLSSPVWNVLKYNLYKPFSLFNAPAVISSCQFVPSAENFIKPFSDFILTLFASIFIPLAPAFR